MNTSKYLPLTAALAFVASPAYAPPMDFFAILSGANEVLPTVGDPDGSGFAWVTIDPDLDLIDWNITVLNLEPSISGAHIHEGGAGVNGPVQVDFSATLSGSVVSAAWADLIVADPAGFYVNIHTTPSHRAGAIRGQLQPVPEASTVLAGAALAGLVGYGAWRRRK